MDELMEFFGTTEPVIMAAFEAHKADVDRLAKLEDYFNGQHDILERQALGPSSPNNQIVANHAKYISTMLTGYFIGNPVLYKAMEATAEDAVSWIVKFYRKQYVPAHDYLIAKHASIMGVSYELMYVNPDEEAELDDIKLKDLSPKQTFLIEAFDLERTVKGGIHFISAGDDLYYVYAYNDAEVRVYETEDVYSFDFKPVGDVDALGNIIPSPHLFGSCPIIRYANNEVYQGDFEQVTTLIDAYNTLQSDRLNNKEQIVDAILIITGGRLPDNGLAGLKKNKLLELPDETMTAEWLTQELDEAGVELLRSSLKRDIHEFSFTPALSDENFAGTSSGEAMKFKLFGTEQVLQEKETYFEKSLRLRFKRIFTYLSNTSQGRYEYSDIRIAFDHAMPNNLPNPIEIINQLRGVVSNETLYGLLPFIEKPEDEMVRMANQLEAESKRTSLDFPAFESEIDNPAANVVDDEEDEE